MHLSMPTTSPYHVNEEQLSFEEKQLAAAKADPQAFGYFYKQYFEPIFRFVYQRVDSQEVAADITSQVFMNALVNINKFEYRGLPISAWFYRIARNELNQYFRKSKKFRTINIETAKLKEMGEEMQLEPAVDLQPGMIAAIDELPDADIELIEMRFFEKRPFKEIGEILEITENNAKVKTYRILEKIRKKLIKKN